MSPWAQSSSRCVASEIDIVMCSPPQMPSNVDGPVGLSTHPQPMPAITMQAQTENRGGQRKDGFVIRLAGVLNIEPGNDVRLFVGGHENRCRPALVPGMVDTQRVRTGVHP